MFKSLPLKEYKGKKGPKNEPTKSTLYQLFKAFILQTKYFSSQINKHIFKLYNHNQVNIKVVAAIFQIEKYSLK